MRNNKNNDQQSDKHITNGSYFVILWTWYQELPNVLQKEVMRQYPFETIEEAAIFLGENIERLTNDFPVSNIEISFCSKNETQSDINSESLTWIEKDDIAGKCLNNFLKAETETSPLYGISSKLLRQLIIEGIDAGLNYKK